jgi:benzoyl-CoA-dihydrodiol lyase
MAETATARPLANGKTRIDFQTEPARYRHWQLKIEDDGSASVSLPELPLLAVLPGTGGLTRVSDKRKVRRDHADVFCTTEEGVKGKRAVEWRLVDDVVPGSKFDDTVMARAKEFAAKSPRNGAGKGIALTPLTRTFAADGVEYGSLTVEFNRAERIATITLRGPAAPPPASAEAMVALGAKFWPLQLPRELDDAILNIRLNELDVAAIISSMPTRTIGWRAKSAICGSACSSASISPRARWSA